MGSLDELLQSVEPLRDAVLVGEMSGGQVSNSYLLALADQQLVLRVDTPLATELPLDRKRELTILNLVCTTGLGPKVQWASPERGLLVTEYLVGDVLSSAEITTPENICRLASVLRKVHKLPADPAWPSLIDILKDYQVGFTDDRERKLIKRAISLADELGIAELQGSVLCHGDVHAANVIDAGELRLLDWEYAGRSHPYFDLATFAMQHQLSKPQIELLLRAYHENSVFLPSARFALYCELYDLVESIWRIRLSID